jgi:hypothetical protein
VPHRELAAQEKNRYREFQDQAERREDAPLTMGDLQQGLLEVIEMLKTHEGCVRNMPLLVTD